MHNFCSRLSIQVEQTVNKTLINCYNFVLKLSLKTLSLGRKDFKVFIGTSGMWANSYYTKSCSIGTRVQYAYASVPSTKKKKLDSLHRNRTS